MGRQRKPTEPEHTPEPTTEPTTEPIVESPVDRYVESLPERHREIANAFRRLARRIVPELVEGLHWGLPVYSGDSGKVCYLKSFRTHLQIGFWKGADLPDPDSLLRGSGDRIRHVRLRRVDDVDTKGFRAILRAATRFTEPGE